jgi:Toprim domain
VSHGADLRDLRSALNARAADLAISLLGDPSSQKQRELRFGRRGSVSVVLQGPKAGGWYDHERGEGGDLFKLIQRERQCDFNAAVDFAREFVGRPWSPPTKASRKYGTNGSGDQGTRPYALQLWNEGVEPSGSLGESYLTKTRKIPRPLGGWPHAVRYHQGHRALMIASTDDYGEVVGVQLVYLTPDGKKDTARGYRGKQTFGAVSQGAGRLPGSGPELVVAEGPETALSIWVATGREVWCAFGSVSRLDLPIGRPVIIALDDDQRNAPSLQSVRKALSRWRGEGRIVTSITPWPVRRYDKTDFNDLIKESGAAAVRQRFDNVLNPNAARAVEVPLEVARSKLRGVIAEFFGAANAYELQVEAANATAGEKPTPPVHAVKVTLGAGKTEMALVRVIEALRHRRSSGDKRCIVMAVPTLELADELAMRPVIQNSEFGATVWRGRKADDPIVPGHKMCRDIEAIELAEAAGADVESSCCASGKGDARRECAFFTLCGYQAQKREQPDLWLVAHEMLFCAKPRAIGEVACVIVDETPWQDGLEGATGPGTYLTFDAIERLPCEFTDGRSVEEEGRLALARDLAALALRDHPNGPVSREQILANGVRLADAEHGARLVWRTKLQIDMKPGMSVGERQLAAAGAQSNLTIFKTARVFYALRTLLADDGPSTSGWLEVATVDTENGPQRVVCIKGRKPVHAGWQVPTLILDATLDINLVRPHWPAVQLVADIEVAAPNVRVTQVLDRAFSKSFCLPDDKQSEEENARRSHNAEKLYAVLLRERRRFGGSAVAITYKALEDLWRGQFVFPPSLEVAHFNAVSGRDYWRDVRTVIVVGRPMPPPNDIERMAEALTGRAVERLPKGAWYHGGESTIRVKSGPLTAPCEFHPDETAEAIRAQIAEGQVLQAVGRGRGCTRSEHRPLHVIVMTSAPLPLRVDTVTTWDAMKPSPADRMMAHGGVAFEAPADAARAYPDLWRTPDAAKKAWQRCGTNPYEELIIGECPRPLRKFVFQLAGPGRKRARGAYDPEVVTDLKEWLETRLGLLAWSEIEPPATEADDRPNAGPVSPEFVGTHDDLQRDPSRGASREWSRWCAAP